MAKRKAVYKNCICVICSTLFRVHICPSHENRGRFCSQKCANEGNRTHGHAPHGRGTPTYRSWATMLQRCTNPNHPKFPQYGGKGITVDPRWKAFENFLQDMGERIEGTTIDRKNGRKGYFPGNCRWATIDQQQHNIKSNRNFTLHGETLCMNQWAKRLGVSGGLISYRLRSGWSLEDALTKPPNR